MNAPAKATPRLQDPIFTDPRKPPKTNPKHCKHQKNKSAGAEQHHSLFFLKTVFFMRGGNGNLHRRMTHINYKIKTMAMF